MRRQVLGILTCLVLGAPALASDAQDELYDALDVAEAEEALPDEAQNMSSVIRMFELAAAATVNFLPVITKETDKWCFRLTEEMGLDRLDPIIVGVLVFVDQDDREAVGDHATELRMFH